MNVLISNMSRFTKYVDLDGKEETDDIVVIGPQARRIKASIPTSKRLVELTRQYKGVLTFRKAS